MVLGLPRGGIPVAAPIAQRLGVGLYALPVRKIGAPGREELAMGAVAAIGDRIELFQNRSMVAQLRVGDEGFARARDAAVRELSASVARFGSAPDLAGRSVILVDDGLATGATMLAAVQVVATADPAEVIVAVPVAARGAVTLLAQRARVVCPHTPDPFVAVGQAYDDFDQVSDAEVLDLLGR